MRIPFDSLCLAAVIHELQDLAGAKVQKWVQVDPTTLCAELYAGRPHYLWCTWDAQFARLTLGPPPRTKQDLSPLAAELRRRTVSGRFVAARQIGFDRIAELDFATEWGTLTLIAEVMGKHSNLMLTDADRTLSGAAKWLGASRSRRPILPSKLYTPPPTASARSDAPVNEETVIQSLSPFLRDRLDEGAIMPGQILQAIYQGKFNPHRVPGSGVYPLPTGLAGESPIEQYSIEAESWFQSLQTNTQVTQARSHLAAQLRRVQLAREVALSGLREAADNARRAAEFQLVGELILAYGFQSEPGTTQLDVMDYEGQSRSITLNPDWTVQENADRWFKKAKRARQGASEIQDQIQRLSADLAELNALLSNLVHYDSLQEFEKAADFAKSRRWLLSPTVPSAKREDRPFAGHKIKSLQAPGGYTVYYGENAEANDYLTLRMGRPNDLWFHVRGNTSTHVLLPTSNQPDKVPAEVIRFAAQVAARHSPMKHSSFVPVDFTLKRYVRRSKGAAQGTVFYTHEKTIHVEGGA